MIINQGKSLLEEYDGLEEAKLGYNGQGYHAVNVKRYHDDVDIDDIIKKAKVPARFKQEIKNIFNDESLEVEYLSFLEVEADQVIYELSDIGAITKGGKDEHADLQYISELSFLGRSGGWACFQDNGQSIFDDLSIFLEDEDAAKSDILYLSEEAKKILEEINYTKDYIYNFNKNLSFSDFLIDQVEQKTAELQEEEEDLQDNQERFKQDITTLAKQIEEREDIYQGKGGEDIYRHLIGLQKAIKRL